MRSIALLLIVASVAFGDWGDVLSDPPKAAAPPTGRLISREVFDFNGKRVAIEEYTDARPRTETAKAAKQKTEKAKEAEPYKFINGHWYKWDGSVYRYCSECAGLPGPTARSVPQANPTMRDIIVLPATASNTWYPAQTRTARTTIGVSGAVSLGGTRGG